jgi:hypothetical protein
MNCPKCHEEIGIWTRCPKCQYEFTVLENFKPATKINDEDLNNLKKRVGDLEKLINQKKENQQTDFSNLKDEDLSSLKDELLPDIRDDIREWTNKKFLNFSEQLTEKLELSNQFKYAERFIKFIRDDRDILIVLLHEQGHFSFKQIAKIFQQCNLIPHTAEGIRLRFHMKKTRQENIDNLSIKRIQIT